MKEEHLLQCCVESWQVLQRPGTAPTTSRRTLSSHHAWLRKVLSPRSPARGAGGGGASPRSNTAAAAGNLFEGVCRIESPASLRWRSFFAYSILSFAAQWCVTYTHGVPLFSRGRIGWVERRQNVFALRRTVRREGTRKCVTCVVQIKVSSDAPIPHCAGCQKMSVVRPVCLFFLVLGLPAATPGPFIVFPASTSLHGKCAERRGRAPAVLFTEEDDRSSIVSLHFLRWRARRLMLHRPPAFCASAAAGAFCSLALFSCLVLLRLMSWLISCSALCVYVMVASGLFQSSSLAKKATRVGVFARLRAQRRILVAQFQSNAIWPCKLVRADC